MTLYIANATRGCTKYTYIWLCFGGVELVCGFRFLNCWGKWANALQRVSKFGYMYDLLDLEICSTGKLNPGLLTLPYVVWSSLQNHTLAQPIHHPNIINNLRI